MPLLYYPARLVESGLGQFNVQDNTIYTDPENKNMFVWLDWRAMSFSDDIEFTKEGKYDPNDVNHRGQAGFENFIRDTRFKGKDSGDPYNPGEFLIIGAGLDRVYGTEDDIRNW